MGQRGSLKFLQNLAKLQEQERAWLSDLQQHRVNVQDVRLEIGALEIEILRLHDEVERANLAYIQRSSLLMNQYMDERLNVQLAPIENK